MLAKQKAAKDAEVLKALGHPTRLCIVKGLSQDGCNVGKMVSCLKEPQPTISQHLKVLKSAGIIRGRRNGAEICYEVINNKAKKIIDAMN